MRAKRDLGLLATLVRNHYWPADICNAAHQFVHQNHTFEKKGVSMLIDLSRRNLLQYITFLAQPSHRFDGAKVRFLYQVLGFQLPRTSSICPHTTSRSYGSCDRTARIDRSAISNDEFRYTPTYPFVSRLGIVIWIG